MDQTTVEKLKLGTKKLKYQIPVRNIDGTNNKAGHITDYIDLIITRGTKKVPTKFYVINLEGDRAILGYPWLRDFNPDIDWPTGKLRGPQVEIQTLFYSRFPTMCRIMEKRANNVIPALDHPSNDIKVRAAETQNPETPSKEPKAMPEASSTDQPPAEDLSQLPEAYKEFAPIFAKPVAGQLPPHQPWDLKVRLIPNVPLSLCHDQNRSFRTSTSKKTWLEVSSESPRHHTLHWSSITRRKMAPTDPSSTTGNSTQLRSRTSAPCLVLTPSSKTSQEWSSLVHSTYKKDIITS